MANETIIFTGDPRTPQLGPMSSMPQERNAALMLARAQHPNVMGNVITRVDKEVIAAAAAGKRGFVFGKQRNGQIVEAGLFAADELFVAHPDSRWADLLKDKEFLRYVRVHDPATQIPVYVSTFDIALQPAVVSYASPLKLFEYLALGRAIVAPNQPNICEVLDDGVNAVLFDPKDPEGLTNAIGRLSTDEALRSRVASGARRTIAEKGLTWSRNAERVTALFEELLRRNGRPVYAPTPMARDGDGAGGAPAAAETPPTNERTYA